MLLSTLICLLIATSALKTQLEDEFGDKVRRDAKQVLTWILKGFASKEFFSVWQISATLASLMLALIRPSERNFFGAILALRRFILHWSPNTPLHDVTGLHDVMIAVTSGDHLLKASSKGALLLIKSIFWSFSKDRILSLSSFLFPSVFFCRLVSSHVFVCHNLPKRKPLVCRVPEFAERQRVLNKKEIWSAATIFWADTPTSAS